MIQLGSRYCGLNFFDAKDADWNLIGHGQTATWSHYIRFPKEFTSEPIVQLSVSGLNATGPTCRYSLLAGNVTAVGFELQINVWGGTELSAVGVNWIATDEWFDDDVREITEE